MTRIALCLFALILVGGCASTKVSDLHEYEGQRLPRPGRIIVHDFAGTPADIPAGSAMAGRYSSYTVPQSPDDIAAGRRLGAAVAKELIAEIRSWGLPAVPVAGQPAPQIDDIVLMGYFESVDTGSMTKRIVLGFGSGAAHLATTVEGYHMTRNGLQRLGSGEVTSGGGKAPGVAVPLVMAVASGNPIGLIVSSAAKVEGEASGRTTIEGAGKRTAEAIGAQLKLACQRQGWI